MKAPFAVPCLLAALITFASADTFHLKDGSKLEGKILKETPESYLVEVLVTRTIKEERTLAKTDVTKVEREKLDEKAFLEISKYTPTPDLLSPAEYQTRLNAVYKFAKDFPKSPHAEKARQIAGELEKESDAVMQGGVKLGGKIISNSEKQADRVDIEARLIDASIRNYARNSAWVNALREFAKLESDYSNTTTFRDSIPFIKTVMAQYQAQLQESLSTYSKRIEDRKIGLERMDNDDRTATSNALNEQTAAIDARYASEKKNNVKWITPDAFNKATLDDALRTVDQEAKRLDTLRIDTKLDAGKAWRDAWAAVHGTDPKVVATAIADARTNRIPDSLISELDAVARKNGLIK